MSFHPSLKFALLGCFSLLCPIAAWSDIHDDFHACVQGRLQQLQKAGFQISTPADQFFIGYGYWLARSGLPRDPARSAQWMSKAAAAGHPGAQTLLGYFYEQDQGVPKNYNEGVRWIRLALAQN